ncbi:MAG: Gfo/Idh/MocA family oxidoreductase [Terrimicrobiaceae bacterium]
MDLVRFALIGCGRMGITADDVASHWITSDLWMPLSHASAIRASPECDLVAVCDSDPARLHAARERYKVEFGFENVEEMLDKIRPDAVCIATRTRERAPIIRTCIAAGVKGIFCEKPLSLTLEDADEIHSLVQNAGIPFLLGTRRRFMPVYERARNEFWSGRVGEPQTVLLEFGAAPLLWTHPHTVDLAFFMANDSPMHNLEAKLDYPSGSWSGNKLDCDPYVRHAILEFRNHITAHILRSGGLDVVLSGSEGKITIASDGLFTHMRLKNERPGKLDAGMFGRRLDIPTPREISGTVATITLLAKAVKGDKSGLPDANCFLNNMEVLFGLVESDLRSGERVDCPLPRRGLQITGRIGNLYP